MGSVYAYTTVQGAVTKKPGCVVSGDGDIWLNDIHNLLSTAKRQLYGLCLRTVCYRKTLNNRKHNNSLLVVGHKLQPEAGQ